MDRDDGTAILAEGLVEQLAPEDLEAFGELERDEHDHVRLAEVNLGDVVKAHVALAACRSSGLDTGLVTKDIGYELRCADPIPFDMEYTRDLGYCAAQYALDGGTDAMVDAGQRPLRADAVQRDARPDDRSHPGPPGGYAVRAVPDRAGLYGPPEAARTSRMPRRLARLASVVRQTPEEFEARFGYLVANEPLTPHQPLIAPPVSPPTM